jgi:hypothetical protein
VGEAGEARQRGPGEGEPVVSEALQPSDEELRQRARHMVYERLALLSAVIWVVGTAILFIATVPVVDRPQRYIAVAMVIPLIPAALPWLFYGAISESIARRWIAQSRSSESSNGSI